MLQNNLDILASEHPEYRQAIKQVGSWFESRSEPTINISTVAKDLKDIDSTRLAVVLMVLVQAGFLKQTYKVMTPSGVMADGEFDDPSRIPDHLTDRWNNAFDTSEADVVPFFSKVG